MSWTSPEELLGQVSRLWERGALLRASLSGEPLFPKGLRLRRPTANELGARFDEVRRWILSLEEGARAHGYVLEFEEIVHRQLGRNRVPAQVVVASEADALRMLGKARAAERFHALRQRTIAEFPALEEWVTRAPMKLVEHERRWPEVLAVLGWFSSHPRSGLYRRQLEIAGVDTKFIEQHQRLLAELLERVLPAEALREGGFDQRFGLREKPTLIRFRLLDSTQLIAGLSDLSIPSSDLARLELPVDEVIVTENEVNGLALPPRPRTLVVFAAGYALEKLGEVPWFKARRLRYWGDIDTHGFAMLDRFRAHFPAAQSLLMDHETFFAHRAMWGHEPAPSTESLDRLTPGERDLHRELVRGTHGERLRLEQERVSFGWVRAALCDRGRDQAP